VSAATDGDDPFSRETPVPDPDEYPPQKTGRYRIKPLPREIDIPQEVQGRPDSRFFEFIRDQFSRQDLITKEERYALTAYRAYTDDKLDEQARELADQRDILMQAVGTLHDLGTAVHALKDLPDIVGALGRDVRQLRRCINRIEQEVSFTNSEVRSARSDNAELAGRMLAVEAKVRDMWTRIHALEEAIDLKEADDESEASAAATIEAGATGDAPER